MGEGLPEGSVGPKDDPWQPVGLAQGSSLATFYGIGLANPNQSLQPAILQTKLTLAVISIAIWVVQQFY